MAGQVLSPPPLTRAVLTLGEAALVPMLTGTLMTGALAPGISTLLLVQVTVLAVLALQSQPVPQLVAGSVAVMPVGSVSLTVYTPVVAEVALLALLTVMA